jgi:uncharacterized protein (DUF305 family)
MYSVRRDLPFAFAFSLVISSALAQPAGNAPSSPMPGMAGGQNGGAAPASPADSAMMAGMEKMNQNMSGAPMTGNADRDFVAMMIPHHQGAVDMAQVELRYGKDPMLRKLAKSIIAAQDKEIAEMRSWQAKHHGS